MDKRTLGVVVGLVAALLFAIWQFWAGSEEPAPRPEQRAAPELPPVPTAGREQLRKRLAEKPATEPQQLLEPQRVQQALERMELPGATRIRCEAQLPDGLYEITGPLMDETRFVTVAGGELFAAVQAAEGRAPLAQELQQVAWLSWSGDSCEVQGMERTTVSGRVLFADEEPGVYTVMGCLFGEVVEVGEDGDFELPAVVGQPCMLIAVREDEDYFGRGPVVELEVEGPVEGVEVPGPAFEELWGPEQQVLFARQLASMGDQRLLELQDRERPELELDDPELSPLLNAWADQDDQRQEAMAAQLDALEDPEQQRQALIETFLGLY